MSGCNQWENSAPSFPDMSPRRHVVNAGMCGKCHSFCGLFRWHDTPAHKQNNQGLIYSAFQQILFESFIDNLQGILQKSSVQKPLRAAMYIGGYLVWRHVNPNGTL